MVPVLGRDAPHHLELDPVGVLGVQRLGHPVVAGADQGAAGAEPGADLGQLGQRADLPGQVVQADLGAAGHHRGRGADAEQAEVVVVGRPGRPQEGRPARDFGAHLEAEHAAVEVHGGRQVADVEHGVVEAADSHRGHLP
jgi:hypothetical protein